jgi:hypothetical protein
MAVRKIAGAGRRHAKEEVVDSCSLIKLKNKKYINSHINHKTCQKSLKIERVHSLWPPRRRLSSHTFYP